MEGPHHSAQIEDAADEQQSGDDDYEDADYSDKSATNSEDEADENTQKEDQVYFLQLIENVGILRTNFNFN